MKRLTTFLILFFVTSTSLTLACDCDSQGHFLTVSPKSKLVALVKIDSYLTFKDIYGDATPMSMEVEILKVFHGQETRNKITVWGDNGALCRPYLSKFIIGEYYVIAFNKGQKGSEFTHIDEKETDYIISSCGEFWLTADINNKIAKGAVSKTRNEIGFKDLLEYFNGDKIKGLTPTELKDTFLFTPDFPKPQQNFHFFTYSTRKQILIHESENFKLYGDSTIEKEKIYYASIKFNPYIGFDDFKVNSVDHKKYDDLDFNSNKYANNFRTILREGFESDTANFAGHDTFVYWGCGSTCQNSLLIDRKTGKIYDSPSASLGYDFRVDSNMLIVNPPDTSGFFNDCFYCIPIIYIFDEQTKTFKERQRR